MTSKLDYIGVVNESYQMNAANNNLDVSQSEYITVNSPASRSFNKNRKSDVDFVVRNGCDLHLRFNF